jgi:hypothetical protein
LSLKGYGGVAGKSESGTFDLANKMGYSQTESKVASNLVVSQVSNVPARNSNSCGLTFEVLVFQTPVKKRKM